MKRSYYIPMILHELPSGIASKDNHYWVVTPGSNHKFYRLHQIIGAQTMKEVVSALNHDTSFAHKCETNNFKFYSTSEEAREEAKYVSKQIHKEKPGLYLTFGVLHAEIGKDDWEIKAMIR